MRWMLQRQAELPKRHNAGKVTVWWEFRDKSTNSEEKQALYLGVSRASPAYGAGGTAVCRKLLQTNQDSITLLHTNRADCQFQPTTFRSSASDASERLCRALSAADQRRRSDIWRAECHAGDLLLSVTNFCKPATVSSESIPYTYRPGFVASCAYRVGYRQTRRRGPEEAEKRCWECKTTVKPGKMVCLLPCSLQLGHSNSRSTVVLLHLYTCV